MINLLRHSVLFADPSHSISRTTPTVQLVSNRDATFARALLAVRQGDFQGAERTLANGNNHRTFSDAHFLNLLGVVYELSFQWRLARRCYSRAARMDRRFAAPFQNLQRYYELTTFGQSKIAIRLGDEEAELS